jgi:cell division protein FtsZ
MIDEKLEDEVWITVVATGYGDAPKPQTREREPFREPLGEPRVTRNREPVRAASRSSVDVDVPEFIPRF